MSRETKWDLFHAPFSAVRDLLSSELYPTDFNLPEMFIPSLEVLLNTKQCVFYIS